MISWLHDDSQDVEMREVKKMLGSHNKEVTALQKKINTLVSQREKNS